jgi:hypothetical protein
MERFLLIALMCILSLQATLGAVAEYCSYQVGEAQISHPGHHEHKADTSNDKGSKLFPQAEHDCAHHCFSAVIPATAVSGLAPFPQAYSLREPDGFRSAILPREERPPLFGLA